MFSLLSFAACQRTLVLLGEDTDSTQYTTFFEDLQKYSTSFEAKTLNSNRNEEIALERFGEKLYDTVVVIGHESANFGQNGKLMTHFIEKGGNLIVFANDNGISLQNLIFKKLSLQIERMPVQDIKGNKRVILRNIVAPKHIVSVPVNPLVYYGYYAVIPRPNDFRIPVVVGGLEHVGFPKIRTMKKKYGSQIIPISCFQGRTGGRITVILASDFATDETYEKKVTVGENFEECEPIENGNRVLMEQLIQWVTHYKSAAHIVEATHYDATTKISPVQYTYNQPIHVVAKIEEEKEGKMVPYTGEVQVEIFMLGTFVRRHMKMTEEGKFEETLNIPDRAGNYMVKVFTDNGDGYQNAREEMAIAVRPLGIREKEHFLMEAKPYNASSIVIMIATLLVTIHYLYHMPSN